ncbi:MAG: SDR family NAD(P)-dependent oxidoreductase [Proteobacteria bacterium]|nr:SDR family NAD(P)-dependent oxidoreductase [Pseudomonadota bacterium]
MKSPRSILITGASSGIGAALARAYAGPGVFLALSGRNEERLDKVAGACRKRGAVAEARILDVTDGPAMARWLAGVDGGHPLDLVIANAGISGAEDRVREIFAVNLAGVLNTVLPAIPPMRGRGRGQIAIMSSIAGIRGLPSAPAYAASKAAVKAYGEGLRGSLAADGVRVSVICPGFVKSPMTASNRFPMPFLMEAHKAARIIRRGLAREAPLIAFPWPLVWGLRLVSALPSPIADSLLGRLPAKS